MDEVVFECLRDLLANNAAVQRVQTVDERLMYVDLQIHGRSFRMISVYLPHAGFAEDVLMQICDSSQCMTSMEPQGASGQRRFPHAKLVLQMFHQHPEFGT